MKSSDWKVVGAQSLEMLEGGLGGGFDTRSFAIYNPGELRWYIWYKTMSYMSSHNEMIIDDMGNVTVNKNLASQAYGGEIKTIDGSDVWKINQSFDNPGRFYYFKNDLEVDVTKGNSGRVPNYNKVQASEDGLLTTSTGMPNSIGFYHFASNVWKDNRYSFHNHVMARYNGQTYGITFPLIYGTKIISIVRETDNKVEKPLGFANLKSIYYPMEELKNISGEDYGSTMYSTMYNDNVFVVQHLSGHYLVYKINLTNLTAELVLKAPMVVSYGLPLADIINNYTYAEVDDVGNLYIVEVRREDKDSYYSVRRYSTSGGNEVFLKESDLLSHTSIEALKFFNGKLHVAVKYKETLPDSKPNDNSSVSVYHMHIICPK